MAQIFLHLALLPLLGQWEAIGTLGHPIASKKEDTVVLSNKQTNTGLYNIDQIGSDLSKMDQT